MMLHEPLKTNFTYMSDDVMRDGLKMQSHRIRMLAQSKNRLIQRFQAKSTNIDMTIDPASDLRKVLKQAFTEMKEEKDHFLKIVLDN